MPADAIERGLAAVLVADIAGYRGLVGLDEEGTLARLKALRRELIDLSIAEHKGCIVNTTVDRTMTAGRPRLRAIDRAIQ